VVFIAYGPVIDTINYWYRILSSHPVCIIKSQCLSNYIIDMRWFNCAGASSTVQSKPACLLRGLTTTPAR